MYAYDNNVNPSIPVIPLMGPLLAQEAHLIICHPPVFLGLDSSEHSTHPAPPPALVGTSQGKRGWDWGWTLFFPFPFEVRIFASCESNHQKRFRTTIVRTVFGRIRILFRTGGKKIKQRFNFALTFSARGVWMNVNCEKSSFTFLTI